MRLKFSRPLLDGADNPGLPIMMKIKIIAMFFLLAVAVSNANAESIHEGLDINALKIAGRVFMLVSGVILTFGFISLRRFAARR